MLHVCAILGNVVWTKLFKRNAWNYMRIADWVYYLCGVCASTLPLGIVGAVEENVMSKDDLAVCIIFICACIVATSIMILQKVWRIQYNNEILIFRNSFGCVRQYRIDELEPFENGRLCGILCNRKRIIQWDTLIMNTEEEISLCRFLSKGKSCLNSNRKGFSR